MVPARENGHRPPREWTRCLCRSLPRWDSSLLFSWAVWRRLVVTPSHHRLIVPWSHRLTVSSCHRLPVSQPALIPMWQILAPNARNQPTREIFNRKHALTNWSVEEGNNFASHHLGRERHRHLSCKAKTEDRMPSPEPRWLRMTRGRKETKARGTGVNAAT